MADLGDSRPQGRAGARRSERAGAIIAELADAFGSALMAVAEEQGVKAGERVSAVAEAARCAARSLDQSGSAGIARGVDRAADRIDHVAGVVRRRDWREIAAATGDFARRRPGLFGLGAVAVGFLVGRLLTLPADRPIDRPADRPADRPGDRNGPDERPAATEGGDGKAADGAAGGRPNGQADRQAP
jgi:hypothetical protein